MAILWFSNETPSRFGQGGQRRQFFQIDALVRDGFDVQVVTMAGDQDGSSLDGIANLHRADWWWRGLPLRLDSIARTDRVVRRHRWGGIVVAHSESWSIGRRLAARAAVPAFVDLHNVHSAWYAAAGNVDRAAHYERVERDILRRAEMVSVCSPREIERLPDQVGAEVVVMAHGIDPGEWSLPPREPRPVIKMFGNWGWEPNEAGLRWFLDEVWPGVLAAVPEATCEIAGAGGRFEGAHGSVQFVGRVDSVNRFVADSAAVAVPVRSGVGAPVKYAEALASGVPVIATIDGAHGVALTGALVSDEAAAWVEKLTALLRDPRAFRPAAAVVRERCLAELSWYAQSQPLLRWAGHRVTAR